MLISVQKLEAKIEPIFHSDPSMIHILIDVNASRNDPIGKDRAATADSKANTIFVLLKVMFELTE